MISNIICKVVVPLMLCLAAAGCIREDRSDCVGVTVRVEAAVPSEAEAIEDVVIYVFDSDGGFLERRVTQLGRNETLVYPNAGELTVVSWCNILDGSVDVTPFTAGSTLSDGAVSLRVMPQNANIPEALYFSPGDLFFGSVTVNNDGGTENVVLPVSRKVGAMNIRVRGLTQFTGIVDNNYSLVVGTTKNKVDFTGAFFGDDISYLPASAFVPGLELVAPTFNLFPSTEGELFSVRIFHNDDLIYEAVENNDGTPLRVIVNQTLNVLIDFTPTGINVTALMTGWGAVHIWEKIYP